MHWIRMGDGTPMPFSTDYRKRTVQSLMRQPERIPPLIHLWGMSKNLSEADKKQLIRCLIDIVEDWLDEPKIS